MVAKKRESVSLTILHAKQMPNKAELRYGMITESRLMKRRLSNSVVNKSSRADTKQAAQFRLD